jgi:hypothetical protein
MAAHWITSVVTEAQAPSPGQGGSSGGVQQTAQNDASYSDNRQTFSLEQYQEQRRRQQLQQQQLQEQQQQQQQQVLYQQQQQPTHAYNYYGGVPPGVGQGSTGNYYQSVPPQDPYARQSSGWNAGSPWADGAAAAPVPAAAPQGSYYPAGQHNVYQQQQQQQYHYQPASYAPVRTQAAQYARPAYQLPVPPPPASLPPPPTTHVPLPAPQAQHQVSNDYGGRSALGAPATFSAPAAVSYATAPSASASEMQRSYSDAARQAPAALTEGDSRKWPPSLNQFVQKAFAAFLSSKPGEPQSVIGTELRQLIAKFLSEGTVWTTAWGELAPEDVLPCLRPSISASPSSDFTQRTVDLPLKRSAPKGKKKSVTAKKAARNESGSGFDSTDAAQNARRLQRFRKQELKQTTSAPRQYRDAEGGVEPAGYPRLGDGDANMELWDSLTVKGTCAVLEKEYFRLTSAPDPTTVRPEHILVEALAHLRHKWSTRASNPKVDYVFMCSQLKAVRQDLTVQRIKSAFTVEVYEMHARIALEEGDLNEYNQCQTQLKELYKAGLGGSVEEFLAYRILYYLYLQTNEKYSEGSKDILRVMREASSSNFMAGEGVEPATTSPVSHALSLREAMTSSNYHKFFTLYRSCPNLGKLVINFFADKIRLLALVRIVKA